MAKSKKKVDEEAQQEREPETVRFVMPVPFGSVAMELSDGKVTRVLINPKKKQVKDFPRFEQQMGESEELEELFGRLSEYFAGVRRKLDLDWDLPPDVTGLPRRIFKETAKIPYGRTRTYREVATAAGQEDAYRVVLATLIENPLPLVVPCHRVTTNKSGIGSYVGGKKVKRWLVDMEKRAVKERTVG